MSDQLNLFEDKPHINKENIKNYNSYSRIKIGYHKPLEVIDKDVDIEFLEEKKVSLNKEAN